MQGSWQWPRHHAGAQPMCCQHSDVEAERAPVHGTSSSSLILVCSHHLVLVFFGVPPFSSLVRQFACHTWPRLVVCIARRQRPGPGSRPWYDGGAIQVAAEAHRRQTSCDSECVHRSGNLSRPRRLPTLPLSVGLLVRPTFHGHKAMPDIQACCTFACVRNVLFRSGRQSRQVRLSPPQALWTACLAWAGSKRSPVLQLPLKSEPSAVVSARPCMAIALRQLATLGRQRSTGGVVDPRDAFHDRVLQQVAWAPSPLRLVVGLRQGFSLSPMVLQWVLSDVMAPLRRSWEEQGVGLDTVDYRLLYAALADDTWLVAKPPQTCIS